MGWTNWLTPARRPDEASPSVRDITFDAGAMVLVKQETDVIEWTNPDQDRVIARVERHKWNRPLAAWTLEALRTSCRHAAASQDGGIVSVTLGRAGDVPIAKVITKFKEGTGYRYDGSIMVRFPEALYTLTLQAGEHGRTGAREAMTNAILLPILVQTGALDLMALIASGGGKIPGFSRDPYDERYAGPTLHSYSDDDRLDALLPGHALSKVRQWLAAVEQTLEVRADVRSAVLAATVNPGTQLESQHRMPAVALGILYLQSGHTATAERMFVETVPLKNGEPDIHSPDVTKNLIMLGVAREMLGRLDDAIWAHEWAVRASVATAGDTAPETVRARANLSRAYVAAGRFTDAEPMLLQAIPLFEADQNGGELSVALNALGLVRQSQDRHAEAMDCFERTLTLFEELDKKNFDERAAVLRHLARSAAATGDEVRSRGALMRAEEMARRRS